MCPTLLSLCGRYLAAVESVRCGGVYTRAKKVRVSSVKTRNAQNEEDATTTSTQRDIRQGKLKKVIEIASKNAWKKRNFLYPVSASHRKYQVRFTPGESLATDCCDAKTYHQRTRQTQRPLRHTRNLVQPVLSRLDSRNRACSPLLFIEYSWSAAGECLSGVAYTRNSSCLHVATTHIIFFFTSVSVYIS